MRSSDPNPTPSNQPSSYKQGVRHDIHLILLRMLIEQLSRYRAVGGPFAKVFLGAIFTYQVLYWCWLKLEMDEEKCERNSKYRLFLTLALLFARQWLIQVEEVAALENKARELTGTQK